ncbi:MAG: L-cysteine S-thiosulfotransferase [Betaproteobacteria bacterium]
MKNVVGSGILFWSVLLIGLTLVAAQASALEAPIPRNALKQGSEFTSPEIKAMQADEFANPGMLWVTRGEGLWREVPAGGGKSCAGCHGDAAVSMKGVATRYPRIDPSAARLVNLAGRINLCRERKQAAPALPQESQDLLALSAYVTYQSRGMPMNVTLDPQNTRDFDRGRERYYRRVGQINLACAHCHDRNWGRTLLFESISQGHGTGWPGYRVEWQTFGSLQRRLRACYSGLRAEMPEYGARELLELELFLAWRANGLPIESPGVRR